MPVLFNRIAILGLGLIGGSLARDCKEKSLCNHITAFDISPDTLSYALQSGFIDFGFPTASEAVQNADLIVLAAPPFALTKIAKEMAGPLKPGAIVIDVASVKRQAIDFIAPHIPGGVFFVPSHPIAGSETSGVKAGHADLFAGKRVVLTPEEADVLSEPVAKVKALWEACGAKIDYMPATIHDYIYAYVSHLPQLVACSTWNNLTNINFTLQTAYGITRLSRSDPELWADICFANADYISEALSDFITFGSQIAGELAESEEKAPENPDAIRELFPKIIASCLIATASMLEDKIGAHPGRYAGSGFTDMIAPASSDMEKTLEAISEHPRGIANYLRATLETLQRIQQSLEAKDRGAFLKLFSKPSVH